jgi:hypothetical protein
MRTATDTASNPKSRQAKGKLTAAKETQRDKPVKKQPKKEGSGGDPPEDPSSSSDDSDSDTSSSGALGKSESRGRTRKPKRENYLTKYL